MLTTIKRINMTVGTLLCIAFLAYKIEEKGYNEGINEFYVKFKKYAEEHPDETFKTLFIKEED